MSETLLVNDDKINELGAAKMKSATGVKAIRYVYKTAWLIGVELNNGQKVALYPGSSINPLAAPSFYITEKGADTHVNNKRAVSTVVKKLRKHCDDPGLTAAVKLLKSAINSISKAP